MPRNTVHSEPMSRVDTTWFRMDSTENRMIINGLLFFDAPISLAKLTELLEVRLVNQHVRFRQRPVLSGHRYQWQEMDQVDMGYHVTQLGAMDRLSESDLQQCVGEKVNEPLDSEKPLWRFQLFPDYGNGCAVLVRIHHCYADGIALIAILDSIADYSVLDSSPAAKFSRPKRVPKSNQLKHRLQYALSSLGYIASFGAAWVYELAKISISRSDSKTRFKLPLSGKKTVGWAPVLDVDEVKQVGVAIDCTLNDVILGCVAGSLRRFLCRSGHDVESVRFRTTVPVNLRPLDQGTELGNCFGLVYLELPVSESSAIGRIKGVRRNMRSLKNGIQAVMTFNVLTILGYLPHFVEKWALGFFSGKASAVMTNVPGPTQPVILNGIKLSKPMFWVPQSGEIGFGVSILSYDNKVEFGFLADMAIVPDPQEMIDDFIAEFENIKSDIGAMT